MPRMGPAPTPLEERLWKYVQKGDGCWTWVGSMDRKGYGKISRSRTEVSDGATRYMRAHRAVYEATRGPIAAGLDLDHLCRNRACVNPAHLEPVTRQVNLLRGNGITAANAAKTHCPKGHEYAPQNTYTKTGKTGRQMRECRTCTRERAARNRARRKAAA